MEFLYFCWYDRPNGSQMFVSKARGDGGKDWEYSPSADGAALLSKRMAAIFINEVSGRHVKSILRHTYLDIK